MPITFYKSLNDLPDYENHQMQGRTYRYFNGKVQFPFGFGLSYTQFDVAWKQTPAKIIQAKDTIQREVQVKNIGAMDGGEVVQAYIKYPNLPRMPLKELKAFQRVSVKKNMTQNFSFKIPMSELQKWDIDTHRWKLYKGNYTIFIGNNANDDERLKFEFQVKQLFFLCQI